MQSRPQFKMGPVLAVSVVAAVDLVLLVGAMRSGPVDPELRWFVPTVVPMLNVLGVDAYFLSRRARASRLPFGPQLAMVLIGLYLPFCWVLSSNSIRRGWLTITPVLPGFGILLPLFWARQPWTGLEGLLVAFTTTLLLMGLMRLVVRGRCSLAVLAAIPSSYFALYCAFSP